MYRIDSYFSHTYKSIQEYKSKIDQGVSFYEPNSKRLSMNLPYPQLDNGNIYDKLFYYSYLNLDQNFIQNQILGKILNNQYFNFWGAKLNYEPEQEIYGGEHWRLILDITINGKRKHKEITGHNSFPDGFDHFYQVIDSYNSNAIKLNIEQNINNEYSRFNKKSLFKRLVNILVNKEIL